jgi:ATP phosphoribosyltransferase regulatory subunit
MSTLKKNLLPSGFYDVLPPTARQETQVLHALLSCFESFGYEQVTPPLMEFEESLLSGSSAALATKTFRVMDPLTQKMMGFRADITGQIGRIAASRLADAPRPLRLSYAGRVLQVKAEALKSERQLLQAGFELIGVNSAFADAEVMLLAVESLKRVGITDITIDINVPVLVSAILDGLGTKAATSMKDAIHRKDASRIPDGVKDKEAITTLMTSSGDIASALSVLGAASMPDYVRAYASRIEAVCTQLATWLPNIPITLDALESRGHEYYSGLSFSIFAKGLRHELGRGGRYQLQVDEDTSWDAAGYTLYVTHLMALLPTLTPHKVKIVAADMPLAQIQKLHEEGFVTIWKE